jgi:hypothetical protein
MADDAQHSSRVLADIDAWAPSVLQVARKIVPVGGLTDDDIRKRLSPATMRIWFVLCQLTTGTTEHQLSRATRVTDPRASWGSARTAVEKTENGLRTLRILDLGCTLDAACAPFQLVYPDVDTLYFKWLDGTGLWAWAYATYGAVTFDLNQHPEAPSPGSLNAIATLGSSLQIVATWVAPATVLPAGPTPSRRYLVHSAATIV